MLQFRKEKRAHKMITPYCFASYIWLSEKLKNGKHKRRIEIRKINIDYWIS